VFARRILFAAIWALLWRGQPVSAAGLFPFVLPWDDAGPSVANASGWLDKPAGAHGFVTARHGHLFAGKNRIRFFGVNLTFGANFPAHADAEKIAARMAKFGINCVRFHHMDTRIAPDGLVQQDERTLDPEMLGRLDYFIAQLKKNGIYADLNLHVGREYPGFAKWQGGPTYFKGVDNFFPPMIAQQHDYARALLTHTNAYTGMAYANEPAVALVEINNENGLIDEWNKGALDAMPDPYSAEFRRQWNEWLAKKYGSSEKLASAWNQGAEPLGAEMIRGGIGETDSGWNIEKHEGAVANVQLIHEESNGQPAEFAKITVVKPGTEGWHVQANYPGLQLAAEKSYTVAFFAKSTDPHKIRVAAGQAHAPWQVAWSSEVALTPEWQRFHFVFVPADADMNMRVGFADFGAAGADASLADVSLRPGGIEGFPTAEKLGEIGVFQKKEIGSRAPAAQRDWYRFLFDTEARYWTGMRQFIRGELHAQSLVVGSAAGYSPWPIQAMLDVVDAHAYWQHPHFPHRPWDMNDWSIQNIPMAGAPDGGTLPSLALMRVADKPFIVTEYNHSAPNTYSSEAFLELCAVAALQDWDGVFAFDYSGRRDHWDERRIPNFFDIDQHPAKMATLPAAVALFLRGDITPPARRHVVEMTLEDAIESVRKGGFRSTASAYGIQREETFEHPVAMRIGSVENPLSPAAKSSRSPIYSDNGELEWDSVSHRMLVRTPRSAWIVGALHAGKTIDLGKASITPGATIQNWATLTATVMEGADFKTARRLLITATGYAENTDMHWKDAAKSSVSRDFGKAPSMVEGVPASITLPLAGKYRAWALDERGARKSEVPLKTGNGTLTIELSPEQKTLWWEIAAE